MSGALLESERPWHAERLSMLDGQVRTGLDDLSRYLDDRECLGTQFGAADIVMITVLRRLDGSGLLEQQPTVVGYIARGTARPAFQRAFAAQHAVFVAASSRAF